MRRRWGLFVALALGVILTAILGWRLADQGTPSEAGTDTLDPEITAHARTITLTATDERGDTSYRLRAKTARYYEQPDLWQLELPRWRLPQRDGAPWTGEADRGRAWADATRADLRGNVVMEQTDDTGTTRLETPFMHLKVPERYAETDRAVTLVGPNYRVSGQGARAWLDESRIELTNEARGRHDAIDD